MRATPFAEFDAAYRALTQHDRAFCWQYRLFCDLQAGRFPTSVELATGLGKTSIIALWALALGFTIRRSPHTVPRRLAYIVDRRVVVDQASEFAEQIRSQLESAASDANHALHDLASALRDAGCVSGVIETSTLRGARTLDTRWRDDPSRPAIMVGTVDMIGSRLLFSAYGRAGPWARSLEAGLLGQDCLVVLDEAHLCSPFAATLAAIEDRADRIAPFVVIRMGATITPVTDLLHRTPGLRRESSSNGQETEVRQLFRLLPTEIAEENVTKRLSAPKLIALTVVDENPGARLADWAIQTASQEQGAAIGLVLNTLAEAASCVERLRRTGVSDDSLVTLTGSMRGWDRDAVIDSPQYRKFRSQRDRCTPLDSPAFLVATSCIEVGADIDCDHLGTEACAADSLIQRLGRVNRIGARQQGSSVHIVGNPNQDSPAGRVFARLQELAAGHRLDGAPANLPGRLLSGRNGDQGLLDVRVPPPALTPAVLDDLAITSKYPEAGARPDVGRWLHGSVEEAALYVELAWRTELDWITDRRGAVRLLDAFPISSRETARCPLHEVGEVLAAIRARSLGDPVLASRLVLMTRYGITTAWQLQSLPESDSELHRLMYNSLIVLPSSAGGYDRPFVSAAASARVADVAEEAQVASRRRRQRLWVKSGRLSTAAHGDGSTNRHPDYLVDLEAEEDELIAECTNAASKLLGSGWRLVACAGNAHQGVLVAICHGVEEAEEDTGSLGFRQPVMLDRHLRDAREMADALCNRLRVPDELRAAVVAAAANHDLGKDRPWWQRAVGRFLHPPVAKSGQAGFDDAINRGYRHELGSVADVQSAALLASLTPRAAELCRHLIAAHHGHARPGFPREAAGPLPTDAAKSVLAETPQRFARMQARYGWWALAWLEALVKAADVLASRGEEGPA